MEVKVEAKAEAETELDGRMSGCPGSRASHVIISLSLPPREGAEFWSVGERALLVARTARPTQVRAKGPVPILLEVEL